MLIDRHDPKEWELPYLVAQPAKECVADLARGRLVDQEYATVVGIDSFGERGE